ncbi:MAG: hypothetical protein RLZZ347_409 [Candidatus Parcubacteria bacterium]|jgi:S-DNA-T family DNA segregation ATPase FtsK/SpoIIIE
MAKKNEREKPVEKSSKKDTPSSWNPLSLVREEVLQGIYAIIFFACALFFILASFAKAGLVGEKVYGWLHTLLGIGYHLLPILLIMLGISFLKTLERNFNVLKYIGGFLFFISGLGIIELLLPLRGGVVGAIISIPLLKLFDLYASLIFLTALFVISLIIIFDTELKLEWLSFWNKLFTQNKKDKKREVKVFTGDSVQKMEIDEDEEEDNATTPIPLKASSKETPEEKPVAKEAPQKQPKVSTGDEQVSTADFGMTSENNRALALRPFVPVPLSLLERDKGKPGVGDIKANANIIKRTLQNFGIEVEMDEISIGPSVTRYALKPAEGMKLSRIIALNNDLALALAAHPIRIEAPIPGKSLVGIEIPNSTKTTVGLATLLSNDEYQNSEKPLLVGLGKGISGKSHFANLAKMPHLLIAGATGSGKSVTIHAVITSLLFRSSPENLRFIMIDPKRVELTLYNKIPHLLTPVITEAKKAILSLKWAAKEMDRRYDILEKASVRDIDSYHKNILAPALKRYEERVKEGVPAEENPVPELMPYIVIVIDELADIMQSYPRELEAAIVRLAQMSRAVGIHLILSTQRPSVNVITGLIKANVPARIALQVASQIDSRTILDCPGAEKLLGAGDMLYLSGEMSKPSRIQSAYITENELKKVVKFLVDAYGDSTPSDITMTDANHIAEKDPIFDGSISDDAELGDDDDLYEEAKAEVLKAGKASTSYIQRKLRVGYARAARLVDLLEERGVIGPGDGAKPREVIGGATAGGAPEGFGEQDAEV